VVKVTGARFSVNMISAVAAKGALRFALFDGTTIAKSFTRFCKRLVHDAPNSRHPSRRSRTGLAWVPSLSPWDRPRIGLMPMQVVRVGERGGK
jgi:hypothetical protein